MKTCFEVVRFRESLMGGLRDGSLRAFLDGGLFSFIFLWHGGFCLLHGCLCDMSKAGVRALEHSLLACTYSGYQ